MSDTSILTILAAVALGLLVTLTGGIVYLTTIEWRDRRRQERENREQRKR